MPLTEEDLYRLYQNCLKDAEQRYRETGVEAYRIIADRFRMKLRRFKRDSTMVHDSKY